MNNGSWLLDYLATTFEGTIVNQNGWIAEKHAEFLNSGKIVLQHSRYGELTRRVFEGMACKKLILTDKLDKSTKTDTIFEDGKDLVYYNSLEDCIDKIIYYANNNSERQKIAESGYNKVLNNHTQVHRVDFIIEQWKNFKNTKHEQN
jgi:spore maturation protein CgeB